MVSTTGTMAPSDAALALFRSHLERHGDVAVDGSNRPIYEELERAGFTRAVSTFAGGPESVYRLTKAGFERKRELIARAKQCA